MALGGRIEEATQDGLDTQNLEVLGRDDLAVELYAGMDLATYKLDMRGARGDLGLDGIGYDFGLLSLSYLHRAGSYESLGETELATRYYRQFVDIWKDAEPDLQHYADEARQALARVRERR